METQKGRKSLIFNVYRDRRRNNDTYWSRKSRGQCSGRFIQKRDQISVVTTLYNHEPNEQKIQRQLFITHLKEQIRENAMSMRKFFRSEVVNWYPVESDSVYVLSQFN